ncbi:MAG: hypothetical protein J7K94_01805 [Dehalococcoidia bacterium]|nr:hypothetical protein [Dehalococcoidia bacterium]
MSITPFVALMAKQIDSPCRILAAARKHSKQQLPGAAARQGRLPRRLRLLATTRRNCLCEAALLPWQSHATTTPRLPRRLWLLATTGR